MWNQQKTDAVSDGLPCKNLSVKNIKAAELCPVVKALELLKHDLNSKEQIIILLQERLNERG